MIAVHTKAGKLVAIVATLDGVDMKNGRTSVEIARAIDERFETIDPVTGAISADDTKKRAIDGERTDRDFNEKNAPDAIDLAHLRKAMEARGRASDPTWPAPMIEAEAAAMGASVADLLAKIIAKDDEAIAAEVARRQAKGGE